MNKENEEMVNDALCIMQEYYDNLPYTDVKQVFGQVLEFCSNLMNTANSSDSTNPLGRKDVLYQLIFINLHFLTVLINIDLFEMQYLITHCIDYQNSLRRKLDANSTQSTNSRS